MLARVKLKLVIAVAFKETSAEQTNFDDNFYWVITFGVKQINLLVSCESQKANSMRPFILALIILSE